MSPGPEPLLVLGWGNPDRGDDRIGPLLLRRLRALRARRRNPAGLDLVLAPQLQPEHLERLARAGRALFVDASAGVPAPYAFRRLVPAADPGIASHRLSPGGLLRGFALAYGREPPPSFLLSVRGASFGLGEPLSPEGVRNLDLAWRLLAGLVGSAGVGSSIFSDPRSSPSIPGFKSLAMDDALAKEPGRQGIIHGQRLEAGDGRG